MQSLKLLLALGLLIARIPAIAQKLSATDAKAHEGQHKTVCGTVSEVYKATISADVPTFIDFERPYPSQPVSPR
jgi:hypothetical protein